MNWNNVGENELVCPLVIYVWHNTFTTYWFWLSASISSPPELRRTSSKIWSFLICCSWLSRARMRVLEVRRLLAASRACSALEQAARSFPAPSRICTSLSIFLSTSSSCYKQKTYTEVFPLSLLPNDKRTLCGTVCRPVFHNVEGNTDQVTHNVQVLAAINCQTSKLHLFSLQPVNCSHKQIQSRKWCDYWLLSACSLAIAVNVNNGQGAHNSTQIQGVAQK